MDVESALNRYMDYGPRYALGTIPLAEITEIGNAVRGSQRLTSREQVHAASIELDLAWTTIYNSDEASHRASKSQAMSSLGRSSSLLRKVIASSKSDELAKQHAEFIQSGMVLHEAFVTDSGAPLLRDYAKISAGYGKLARKTLQRYEQQKDYDEVGLIQWLRSIGGFLLMLEQPAGDLLPIPGPTRSSFHPSPNRDNWHFQVWDVELQRIFPVRFSNVLKTGTLTFAPTLLANEGYPSKSHHGTVKALIETQHRANLSYARPDWPEPLTPAQRHVANTFAGFKTRLREHYERQDDKARDERIAEQEERLNQLEMQNVSDKLATKDLFTLAETNITVAVEQAGRAIDTGNEVNINGYFDRARDVYEDIVAALEPGTIEAYEARLGLAALPVYRMIADPNLQDKDSVLADIDDEYMLQLMELGKDVMRSLKSCNPTRPEHKKFQEMSHIILAGISVLSQTHGAYIAAPSLRTERTDPDEAKRSSISIWSMPFGIEVQFAQRAKVAVSRQPNLAAMDHDILPLPLEKFDDNLALEDYQNLIDLLSFRDELTPEQDAYVGRINKMLIAALELVQ